ncbi:MAG TPA: phenylalanine--tRNA ligase subunit alpha [Candidatus Saccharimonadales bacterium]
MSDSINPQVQKVRELLMTRLEALGDNKRDVLRSVELKSLYDQLKTVEDKQARAELGKQINDLRVELEALVKEDQGSVEQLAPIDVTAPFDVNQTSLSPDNRLLDTTLGSIHPITKEMDLILDIFYRLGFKAIETPEIDDDYHMFGSLNFPEGHPAREDYDTLLTTQKDSKGKPFVAPAHTSTMEIRVLKEDKPKLEAGEPIAYVIPGRVFRNEDLDPRHEHTFYQLEGVYVGKGITVANLMSTLQTFMSEYFKKDVELKTQPFYFPFTEPSFEFAISCPFCDKAGCNICSYSGWIELLGCGMTHPNVYREAGIDSQKYTGFAWGIGFMRLAMIKYGIEDIRYFQSGKLDFLRQF